MSNRLGETSCSQRIEQNVLTLSRKVDESKTLPPASPRRSVGHLGVERRLTRLGLRRPLVRGLHSSTFQLTVSRYCSKIHPERPLITCVTSWASHRQPVIAPPIRQKALMLSRKVDECKPLPLVEVRRQICGRGCRLRRTSTRRARGRTRTWVARGWRRVRRRRRARRRASRP